MSIKKPATTIIAAAATKNSNTTNSAMDFIPVKPIRKESRPNIDDDNSPIAPCKCRVVSMMFGSGEPDRRPILPLRRCNSKGKNAAATSADRQSSSPTTDARPVVPYRRRSYEVDEDEDHLESSTDSFIKTFLLEEVREEEQDERWLMKMKKRTFCFLKSFWVVETLFFALPTLSSTSTHPHPTLL